MEQKKLNILIGIIVVAMIVIGATFYVNKNFKTLPKEQTATTQPEPEKTAFVTIQSNTVEGIVTEIITPESLVRIYDPERKVVYSITVPPNTLLAYKGDNSISIGDRIRAVSTTTQDAFEFHADSVTIVSHQADQFPILPSVQKTPL